MEAFEGDIEAFVITASLQSVRPKRSYARPPSIAGSSTKPRLAKDV